MLKEWFWLFKKIKTDEQFFEHQQALQNLLADGQDLHERDPKGRSALEYIFAKAFPSYAIVLWLLKQPEFKAEKEASLYPYDVDLAQGCFQLTKANNMMDKLDELMPTKLCDLTDLAEKQRLAQPYLLLLEKFEAAGLTNQFQSSCADYKAAFMTKQQSLQQLQRLEDELETQFGELCVGFNMLAGEDYNEFQSRIAGSPWLPELDSAIESQNLQALKVISADSSLKLAFQINFAELKGLNPALPSNGLLQVFIAEPEDGEEPVGRCEAIFWTEADMPSANWQQHLDKALATDCIAPSGFDVSFRKAGVYPICWQPYKQLPESEAQIRLAIENIDSNIDAEIYDNLQYDHGLMPRVAELTQLVFKQDGSFAEEPYLPKNHIAILSYLYCDSGSCIYSIPLDALNGDNTDWRQLTYTYCHD
ncbi:YwqG family protein [Shewanella sp. 1CM18E]|uniref:DUF1963 domain-containing protein n=1 Tax=Shewanella sp. 1CM18E TaxID=2929169 RepID=UPI0020BF5931|nr:DUF1963 domain-containing protein [Shewanella sp. 1CM18E]MCK8044568.1 YwqG family protein [Shewanella sp. 1CM18E]